MLFLLSCGIDCAIYFLQRCSNSSVIIGTTNYLYRYLFDVPVYCIIHWVCNYITYISTEQIALGQTSLRAVWGTVHFVDTACAMSVCESSGPSEEKMTKIHNHYDKYLNLVSDTKMSIPDVLHSKSIIPQLSPPSSPRPWQFWQAHVR